LFKTRHIATLLRTAQANLGWHITHKHFAQFSQNMTQISRIEHHPIARDSDIEIFNRFNNSYLNPWLFSKHLKKFITITVSDHYLDLKCITSMKNLLKLRNGCNSYSIKFNFMFVWVFRHIQKTCNSSQ
jgi:hypothetical protein